MRLTIEGKEYEYHGSITIEGDGIRLSGMASFVPVRHTIGGVVFEETGPERHVYNEWVMLAKDVICCMEGYQHTGIPLRVVGLYDAGKSQDGA